MIDRSFLKRNSNKICVLLDKIIYLLYNLIVKMSLPSETDLCQIERPVNSQNLFGIIKRKEWWLIKIAIYSFLTENGYKKEAKIYWEKRGSYEVDKTNSKWKILKNDSDTKISSLIAILAYEKCIKDFSLLAEIVGLHLSSPIDQFAVKGKIKQCSYGCSLLTALNVSFRKNKSREFFNYLETLKVCDDCYHHEHDMFGCLCHIKDLDDIIASEEGYDISCYYCKNQDNYDSCCGENVRGKFFGKEYSNKFENK